MTSLFGFRASHKIFAAASLLALALFAQPASAADAIFAPGQPIITGFSGVVAPDAPPPGSDPLDRTFIDLNGNSVVIQKLEPNGTPKGQLINSQTVFAATAKDVGQVFGVTLDNAPEMTGAKAPNIYVAASSAFGLNLVVTDPDGNPVRSKVGAPGASFAPGQWGAAGGSTGYPGSIWKIDGTTGEVSLFTTIAANTGAGLGDIVFDPASQQFFVSDLDTGLIYRLASDGTIIDSFDHGVTARPTHGLADVSDDGSAVDVTDPAFNTEDPSTWGVTQAERKVWGLGLRGGRLYYAAADGPSIWSVKINPDGSFGTARWELDVTGLASTDEITHIVFDPAGRMILAQRGAQAGSYDYSVLAATGTSSVARYSREFPEDPSTPSSWVETPDSYAIGFKPDGSNATGGVALGYDYDKYNHSFDGACSAYLWSTGEALRDDDSASPPLGPPAQVAGLQGNARSLVRPANDPPRKSFFTDFDGNTDAAEAAHQGHVGGVAIWQQCGGNYVPPDVLPPPNYTPPEHYNLSLDKWASPHSCFDGGANWWCNFTVRVENTGTTPYFGPVTINDHLPDANPGASITFWPSPPWSCSTIGFDAAQCSMGPTLLFPGDTVDLHEVVQLPKALTTACDLPNVASISWPFWGHDDDPSDDFGFGAANIPGAPCAVPPGSVTNLSLSKVALPPFCVDLGIEWACSYAVTVQNTGPGNYSGPITVKDTLSVNAPASVLGPWACSQAGPVLTCHIVAPPVNVPPGWTSGFYVTAHVKKNTGSPLCSLDNKANIASPAGGSPNNALPGDDFGTATTVNLDPACLAPQPHTDLKVEKSAAGCSATIYMGTNGYACSWTLKFTNLGPDNYNGPLTFKDVSAGATVTTLPSPPCSGPPAVQTCTIPSVSLTAGSPAIVPITMFYPDGPSVCSVSNNVSILTPNPGSIPNPAGNDSASANQTVPNPLCNPAAPKLNITKTATGCASDPSSTDWLCDFDIVVSNLGGSPQPAPIVVTDVNSKPTTFSTPACGPSGPNYVCVDPAPLNAGATWTFSATTRVDPNGVTLADCDVVNTVQISTPASADPGYTAQASEKVPQLFINVGPGPVAVYCDPPSLKLAKIPGPCVPSSGGYDCSFTVNATSTGPDPYHGTVELDEVLPDGTKFKSADWTCVPTTGNDVHCSSASMDLAVGKSVSMKIVVFVPKDVGARSCAITNTVNAAISAAVLHSANGAQYTASATDKLPASACQQPPQCPRTQVKPGGGCCPDGTIWNGKQCAPPVVVKPCPPDSSKNDAGACECKDGTHGKPGRCVPDQPVCAPDSTLNSDGACECKDGTHGKPGRCVPNQPVCAPDSRLNSDGACECKDGTHGKPGRCVPDRQVCAPDSVSINGQCVCKPGTQGVPGLCQPKPQACPRDSRSVNGECVCLPGTQGDPGHCVAPTPNCAKDSTLVDGVCQCREGSHGVPGRCVPDLVIQLPTAECPQDSHYDKRKQACVCNPPLAGVPGKCLPQITLQVPLTLSN